jgi:hypothetical protein
MNRPGASGIGLVSSRFEPTGSNLHHIPNEENNYEPHTLRERTGASSERQ